MTFQELEKNSEANLYYDVKSQLKDYVYRLSKEAFEAGRIKKDSIQSNGDLEKYKRDMRHKFIESAGGLPSSETQLNAMITGEVSFKDFRIEKIIYESRSEVYVTANLYIPDHISCPTAAVLFVCGHHQQAKHTEEYQIVCQYLVKAGLIVLAIDPLGQGERFSYYEKQIDGTTIGWGCDEHYYAGTQCLPLGDSIVRYFVHDAMRGIDYLCSRPEVDASRIGVTGNSGGGTQTGMLVMCDPRIAAAVPTTYITDRFTNMLSGLPQDSEQLWPGMSAEGFDHDDVLLMMAPKPTLVLAAKSDFFPIEGTRNSMARCRRFWEMYGKEDSLELYEENIPHKYSRNMAKKAAQFFAYHLLNREVPLEDDDIMPVNPSMLWCTKSGQIRKESLKTRFVYEENCDRLSMLKSTCISVAESERQMKAFEWMKKVVFRNRKPGDLNPRFYQAEQVQDLSVQMCFWWSQEEVMNHAFMFRSYKNAGHEIPVTIGVWHGGTKNIQTHLNWIRNTCDSGRAVMVLDVSGEGALMPYPVSGYEMLDFYGTICKFAGDLIWLNDSLAALRTYDVVRALDMIEEWPLISKDDVCLYSCDQYGLYTQLAVIVDERVKSLELDNDEEGCLDWVSSRHYNSYNIMSTVIYGIFKNFDTDLNNWIKKKKL